MANNAHRAAANAAKRRIRPEHRLRFIGARNPWPPTEGDGHGHYFFANVLAPALNDKGEGTVADVIAQGHKADKARFCADRRTIEQAVAAHLGWMITRSEPSLEIYELTMLEFR